MRTSEDLPPHHAQAIAIKLKGEAFWRYYRDTDLVEDLTAGQCLLYRDVRVVERFPLEQVMGWERLPDALVDEVA